jgi:hypothetical protein
MSDPTALLSRLRAGTATEFARLFADDVTAAIRNDPRATLLGPGARARVVEHAQVLIPRELRRIINDGNDRAEAIERVVSNALRGM